MVERLKHLKFRHKILSLCKYCILILLAYQLLYPVLYMISMSLRSPVDAYDPGVRWIPKNFSMVSFIQAYKAMGYLKALKTSFTIGIVSALFDIISCSLAGYGFARYKFPGKNILFGCVILTLIVPVQTIIVPFVDNMKNFNFGGIFKVVSMVFGTKDSINLIGSNFTFYLPSLFGAGIRSGLYIYIFRQFFEAMPSSLEEAAYVDGSGPLHTFFKVMMPNAKNAIISVFLFSFVWHFNDYYLSKQLLGVSKRTLVVALSSLRIDLAAYVGGQTSTDPIKIVTRMQAGCLLAILPLFILYLFTQKYFTDSIEHIGIK